MRRRREALRWSQAEVARQSRVARTVVCEIEGRPAGALGDEHLTRLAAAVLSARTCALATLAEGLGVAIPAIREGLLAIADGWGWRTLDDGITIHIAPLPGCDDAVRAVSEVEDVATLSDEALAVLMIICVFGEPLRRDLEAYQGEDCASLLDRLRRRGFVEVVGDAGPRVVQR